MNDANASRSARCLACDSGYLRKEFDISEQLFLATTDVIALSVDNYNNKTIFMAARTGAFCCIATASATIVCTGEVGSFRRFWVCNSLNGDSSTRYAKSPSDLENNVLQQEATIASALNPSRFRIYVCVRCRKLIVWQKRPKNGSCFAKNIARNRRWSKNHRC
jgi:hypothetical protein